MHSQEPVFVLEGAIVANQPLEVIDADHNLPHVLMVGEDWLVSNAKPQSYFLVTRIDQAGATVIFDSRVKNGPHAGEVSYLYDIGTAA